MRLGVKFERLGMIKYLAHLDFQTMFNRALRRSGIDAKYSQGFSPHMLISFCYPLSVGMETKGDYFEVRVGEETTGGMMEKIQPNLPEGVRVLKLGRIDDDIEKIMSLPVRVGYELVFEDDSFLTWMDGLMEKQEYLYERERKGKVKTVDLRPYILFCEKKGDNAVDLLIDNSRESSLNPYVLVKCAENDLGRSTGLLRTIRLETYMEYNGEIVPIDKVFK